MGEFVQFYVVLHQNLFLHLLATINLTEQPPAFTELLISFFAKSNLYPVYFILLLAIDSMIFKMLGVILREMNSARKRTMLKARFNKLLAGEKTLCPKDILELTNKERKNNWQSLNQPGIYILFNLTDKIYYVGQSTRMLDRVRQHFLGKGNPDVYADFRYGTNFSIQFVPLSKSSSITLNELDHEAILAYDGFTRGYNRNKGMQK